VFVVVYLFLRLGKVTSGRTGYLSFMCERFTDLVTATGWNIAFLAVVSVWRVFLVTRSLAVLTGAGTPTCLVTVLFPASAIMCVGSFFKSLSLVGIMGGVRLPPHTELLVDATNVVCTLSFWMAVILLLAIGMMVATGSRQTAKRALPWRKDRAPGAGLLAASVLVIAGLLSVIPVQVKVQRNHRLAFLVERGGYRDAIDYASQFDRGDFSGIHYLPPDPYHGYGGNLRAYRELFAELNETAPEWLREVWIDQYAEAIVASAGGVDEEDFPAVRRFSELRKRIEELADEEVRAQLGEQLEEEFRLEGEGGSSSQD